MITGVRTASSAGVASSRSAALVQMSMTLPYSGLSMPSMIRRSRNWRRTSSTTVPAVRPTARIANELKRKAIEPPMSRPMNVIGLATLIWVRTSLKSSEPTLPMPSSLPMRLDVGGEQRDGRDDRRADGEALGDGLRGVADGVEAHHDPLGLAVELARHLRDARRVVGDGAEGVLRDDDSGRGQHAHTGERDQVERELQVAVPEHDSDADGRRDGDDRPDRRLEPGADAREDRRGRPGAGRGGDLLDRLRLGRGVVLRQPAHDLREDEPRHHCTEDTPAGVEAVVADVEQRDETRADDREDARRSGSRG